eukprot:Amastigsp_a510612_102.p1 type:complete len:162 gc:universal Amastigsp_a510612_102:696-211(-)
MRYYCDYCDIFLTQGSASVRRAHNVGRKHKEEVTNFFGQFLQDMPLIQLAVDPFASTNPFDLPPPNFRIHSDLFVVPLEDFSLPPPPLFEVPPHLVQKSKDDKAREAKEKKIKLAPMPVAPELYVSGHKRAADDMDDASDGDDGDDDNGEAKRASKRQRTS